MVRDPSIYKRRQCRYCMGNWGQDVYSKLMRRHVKDGKVCPGSDVPYRQHRALSYEDAISRAPPVVFHYKILPTFPANDRDRVLQPPISSQPIVNLTPLREAYIAGYREYGGTIQNSELVTSFSLNHPDVRNLCRSAGRQMAATGATEDEALSAMVLRFEPLRVEIAFQSLFGRLRRA